MKGVHVMKRKRYSIEQTITAVKEHELRKTATEITRKLDIAEQTFYRWKKKYEGLEPGHVHEHTLLREENAQLKKIVADLGTTRRCLRTLHK
jgi:putative transposase